MLRCARFAFSEPKFFGSVDLPNFLTHGAPLRALRVRELRYEKAAPSLVYDISPLFETGMKGDVEIKEGKFILDMIQTPSLACMFGANQYIFSFGYIKAQLTFFQPFFTFISSTDSPATIRLVSSANSLGVACPT